MVIFYGDIEVQRIQTVTAMVAEAATATSSTA